MIANAGAYYLAPVHECKCPFRFNELTRRLRRIKGDYEKWDRALSVNVKGALFCYKHAAQQMIKQGRGGRIIGAASTASKQGICLSKEVFAMPSLTILQACRTPQATVLRSSLYAASRNVQVSLQSLSTQPMI